MGVTGEGAQRKSESKRCGPFDSRAFGHLATVR